MPEVTSIDVARMRAQLFFEGDDVGRRLSRFWLLLPLSAVIASAGVVGDSTATVIGAMIVAPLMIPIVGTVLAVVLADRDNLVRSLLLLAAGAAAVIAIGYLMGLVVETPVAEATNGQVAARVSPRLIDLIAALATGAVASIALARDDISDTLPGVAIAISLVPPLAVVGLTLEAGERDQALGALLLFVTNVSAILATGLAVMSAFHVARHATTADGVRRTVSQRRATAAIVGSLVVICVPLAATSARLTSERANEAEISRIADEWCDDHGWQLVSVATEPDGVKIRATGKPPQPDTADLAQELDRASLSADSISIELIPSNTVELLAER